jgi:hypothetical protein
MIIIKLILKNWLWQALQLSTLIQTKTKKNYTIKTRREIWVARSKKHKLRKNEKHFWFSIKKAYFSTEIVKNFGQK